MKDDFKDVIIEKDLFSLGTDKVKDYTAHIYCEKGSCSVGFNEQYYTINQGDSAIFVSTKLVHDVKPLTDFQAIVIYVSNAFLYQSSPESNYSVKGAMALYRNPIILLDAKHKEMCRNDFINVENRVNDTEHHFYKEAVESSLRSLFLDFFDFHVRMESGESRVTDIQADLMTRFLNLLENGEYKKHRDISHYADKLCVSSKYLSQVSRKISGFAANYWINRFSAIEIRRYLKDTSLSLTQIADEFEFSSPSHFSRYVHAQLGQYPSTYRKQ